MRVVHLLSSSQFHGAEAAVLELCLAQAREGIDSSVLLMSGDYDSAGAIRKRFEQSGIRCAHEYVSGRWSWQAANALRRSVSSESIDILHSHKYKTTPYALFAARGNCSRVVATYHNWLDETRMLRVYAFIDKHLARFCDACVAVSGAVADELAGYAPAGKVHLIHNGIDTRAWLRQSDRDGRSDGGRLVIGFVGRLSEAKGVSMLLDAIAMLPTIQNRRVECLIVGDGELEDTLRRRAALPDLCGRVEFTGAVSDVVNEYNKMDAICLPSENEGCPMVLIEAMALEIPAVASAVGDIPELVVDDSTGYLLRECSAASICECLDKLLGDDLHRTSVGASARRHVERLFSADFMSSQYRRLYADVLKS